MLSKNQADLERQGYGYIIKCLEKVNNKEFFIYWSSRGFEEDFSEAYIYKTGSGVEKVANKISRDFKNIQICEVKFSLQHGWRETSL